MRTYVKIICLLLCLLMVAPLFAACKKNDDDELAYNEVVKNGKSNYTIVYAKDSAEAKKAATDLRDAIKEKTGVELKLADDSISDTENLILVGTTNRQATATLLSTMQEKDFIIAYRDGCLCITGGNAAATTRAVKYFIANNINDAEDLVTFKAEDCRNEFGYMLGDLKVDGTPLTNYTIVYPASAPKYDKVTYYTAINIQDFFLNNAGIQLNVTSDAATEVANEILVGMTNRTASENLESIELAADQYILRKEGSKIVMLGANSLMTGAAAGAFVNTCFAPTGNGTAVNATVPTAATPTTFTFPKATSAILMVGDGMGMNHVEAGLIAGKANLENADSAADKCMDIFAADLMPYKAQCITRSQSVIEGLAEFTDSAAAGTALSTGYKTYNYYIGTDKSGNQLKNIRELAAEKGLRTAVLTTAHITDATPAAFLAHASSRYDTTLQAQIDKLLENGQVNFAEGDINDLAKVQEKNFLDRTRRGLAAASENNASFFAMIEEAHIDKFSHQVMAGGASVTQVQNAVLYYNEAIAYTMAFVMLHPTTALIVTADHECGDLEIYDQGNGEYYFSFNSDNHTNKNVYVWGMGDGVDTLLEGKDVIDNTDIPKFLATIYGENNFGDPTPQ
ncbi:MAG: alkaline phosphatase [Clostridia bacterium]|nr:alkaline phosphatase [Clostridia bacterium]